MYETKELPQFTKSITDRTVTGIFAVHGNVDEGNDRSWPGSFAAITHDGRNRAKFLWMHDSFQPPIAKIDSIREVLRDELPPAVMAYAPNASGGVEVTRTYNTSSLGEWVLSTIKDGSTNEMSYAYEVTKSDFEEIDGQQIRNIRAVTLYDISDVNWGMNPATIGAKVGQPAGLPLDLHSATVLAAVDELSTRLRGLRDLRAKEGRTFSAANVSRLQSLHDALAAAVADLKTLLDSTAPKTSDDIHTLRAASRQLRAAALDLGIRL
jgi:HK97 family phage prohead protease